MATSTTEPARAKPNGSMHDISLDGAARLAEKQRGVFNFLTWPFVLAQALTAQEVLAGASKQTFISDEEAKATKPGFASPLDQEALFREPGALRGDPASEPAESAALSTENWSYSLTGYAGRGPETDEGAVTGGNVFAGSSLGTNSGPLNSGGIIQIIEPAGGRDIAAFDPETELLGVGSDDEMGAHADRGSGESPIGTSLASIANSGTLNALIALPVGAILHGGGIALGDVTQLVTTPLGESLAFADTITSGSAGAVLTAVTTLPQAIIAVPDALVSTVDALVPVLTAPATAVTGAIGDVLSIGAPLVQIVVPTLVAPAADVTQILGEVLGTGESVVEAVLAATGAATAILSEADVDVSAPLEPLIPPVTTVLTTIADAAEVLGDGLGSAEAVISSAIESLSAIGSPQAATTIVADSTDSVLEAVPLAEISAPPSQIVTDAPAGLLAAVEGESLVQTVVPALTAPASDAAPPTVEVLGLEKTASSTAMETLIAPNAPQAATPLAVDNAESALEAAPLAEISASPSQAVTEVPVGLPFASGGSIDFIEEAATALPADPLFSSNGYTDYGLAIAGEAPASAVVAALVPNPVDTDGEEVTPASGPEPQARAEPEEPPPDDQPSAELQPQAVPAVSTVVSDLDDGWLR